jgi:enoyl-CoA hydratase/carnithine racemase
MSTFQATRTGHVMELRFGAPGSLNLMSDAWFGELADALQGALDDEATRVVTLQSASATFSAGGDLQEFLKSPWASGGILESGLARGLQALGDFDKPLVAAVRGVAIGGGCTLLQHCDFVYAAPGTRFQLPFTQIGIVPELGATWLLAQCAGLRLATELVLLGRPFDAATAQRAGLVNEVVADDALAARVAETAAALAALPPASVRETKRLLKAAHRAQYTQAWHDECAALERTFRGAELQEAARAFLEKRRPDFSGFRG